MFRRIAQTIPDGANNLFRFHPAQVAGLLERAWNQYVGLTNQGQPLGHPENRSELSGLPPGPPLPDGTQPQGILDLLNINNPDPNVRPTDNPVIWDHLIYAYLLESTGMLEIFRKVVFELLHGESAAILREDSIHWLRTTEELFFRQGSPFFIYSLTSDLRPDMKANRCNAYWRMFGMDLPQVGPDGRPYPYLKGEPANRQFVPVFEEFLQEMWVGITNQTNINGPNPTDTARIANLAETLSLMLLDRRKYGLLSREEFWYVSMFSWFHLTLEFNSPIIEDLESQVGSSDTSPSSAAQRLMVIASKVGVKPHPKTEAFFRLADPTSSLLIYIETRALNSPAGNFTTIAAIPNLVENLRQIINNWSAATGKDLKASALRTK